MEQLDLEQQLDSGRRFRSSSAHGSGREAKGLCGNRLIALRRYSPLICFLELLMIGLFLYLLLARSTSDNDPPCPRPADQPRQPRTFVWDNDGGASKLLLLDLIPGCDQRKHDEPMSIKCRSSSQDGVCGPVESRATPAEAAKSGQKPATVIVTSKRGERLARSELLLKRVTCGPDCRYKTQVEVLRTATGQKIIGWGGALTDSSISNLLSLTTNGTRQLLSDYFGQNGLMFNMVRITIGGSDFSSRFYTNDDSFTDDLSLNKFKLREEDVLYKIPVLKLIQQEFNGNRWLINRNGGKLKLFASMWSPPVWMKTNRHFNKGQLRGHIDDEPVLDRSQPPKDELYYDALAELKVRFIQAYQRENITFWGLTVMNEPIFAVQPFLDFNTMIFPSDDYANYVAKYLGPKIKGNPQLNHIKLMAHDDNRLFLPTFTWPILEQRRLRQFIDGVSVHGYADENYHFMNQTFWNYRTDRDMEKAGDADFFVLPTELCSGHLPFMAKALVGNWHRGVHYGLDIIRSLQSAASGWVDWNMILDLEGGPGWLGGRLDAAVIVDKARDLYHKSPMFYIMGQFSRYIPPGSVKLESRLVNGQFDHQFEVVSFLLPKTGSSSTTATEEKVVSVFLNNNPYPVEVHLKINFNTSYLLPCPADSLQTVIYTLS